MNEIEMKVSMMVLKKKKTSVFFFFRRPTKYHSFMKQRWSKYKTSKAGGGDSSNHTIS